MYHCEMVPLEKWSPTNSVPIFLDPYSLPLRTNGIFLGPFFQGWPNFCWPSVHGDQIGWGLFVQRDQLIGYPKWGPNVWGPYVSQPLAQNIWFLLWSSQNMNKCNTTWEKPRAYCDLYCKATASIANCSVIVLQRMIHSASEPSVLI